MSFIVDNTTHDTTAFYGPRKPFLVNGVWTAAFHYGLDIAPEARGTNTKLYCPKPGKVVSVGTKKDAGRFVIVHIPVWNKWIRYCHMHSYGVRAGDTLQEAQYVGLMGATGTATGVHVHFEVYADAGLTKRIDPKPFIWYERNPVDYPINSGKAPVPPRPAPAPAPAPVKALGSAEGAPLYGARLQRRVRVRNWLVWDDPERRYGRRTVTGDYKIVGISKARQMMRIEDARGGRCWTRTIAAKDGLIN